MTEQEIEEKRKKAHELVDAYLDNQDIFMKDPDGGVDIWTNIKDPNYWSFLDQFMKHLDCYKVVTD